MAPPAQQVKLATKFKRLHEPGNPIVLSNIYDAASASVIAQLPTRRALATASFAIAATLGVVDADLTAADNLNVLPIISQVAEAYDLPLSVDIQDGYEDVGETVTKIIKEGVVGCNIEDLSSDTGELHPLDTAVARIEDAIQAAQTAGIPDFVINARTDVLGAGGSIQDVINRGKAYLAAGATTVYVWGGSKGRGVSTDEIKLLVKALDGMINVKMNLRKTLAGEAALTIPELKALGVARVSVGPELYWIAMDALKAAAEKMMT